MAQLYYASAVAFYSRAQPDAQSITFSCIAEPTHSMLQRWERGQLYSEREISTLTLSFQYADIAFQFDDLPSGPLYNPDSDFWFSEGFSVVPPSAQAGSFTPSSGGQLLEFTPLTISSPGTGSGDTAEIGVGPHFAVSCFKFNLYALSLGCAAEGNEQWCEFEFSAYAYDESTGGAQSTSWSETKRVPACPTYPTGPCSLTPVELDGYTNITSVLITLRVGLDLRAWWGDDLRVGWTDNSCEAGVCRGDASAAFTKRERSGLSLRNRFMKPMTTGLKTI